MRSISVVRPCPVTESSLEFVFSDSTARFHSARVQLAPPAQCEAAGAQCMKSGVFVGPGTGTRWPVEKK
jgi:hypothetical protein